MIKMQMYVSQVNIDGTFDVARWNVIKRQYEVIETRFMSEKLSKERARELNAQYESEDNDWNDCV